MKKNLSKISEPGKSKIASILGFTSFALTKPGFKVLRNASKKALNRSGITKEKTIDYNQWILDREHPEQMAAAASLLQYLEVKPNFSILMPVPDDIQPAQLERVVISILNQVYPHWQLTIVYTPAINADSRQLLDDLNKTEQRVHAIDGGQGNCLSDYLGKEFLHFAGPYVLITDAHHLLAPFSLFEFAIKARMDDSLTIIYGDEDEINKDGIYTNPVFKPGFSPQYLMTHNYIGNVFLVKTELLNYWSACFGTLKFRRPYDLLLFTAHFTGMISNITKVLAHKLTETISESDTEANDRAMKASIELWLDGRATVLDIPGVSGKYSLNYKIGVCKKVSIIIPTKDHAALLGQAVRSILAKTDYPDYEIIIINNNSTTPAFFDLIKELTTRHPEKIKCIDANIPFNFSALINIGARASNGAYLLLLNNDVEVIHAGWLTKMVACMQSGHLGTQSHVGAVAPKLLYPNNTIQHAGIALEPDGTATHVFAHMHKDDNGYQGRIKTLGNYTVLTGACMLVEKRMFDKVGGMDETYVVEYSDFDLCLKLLQTGYTNVYLPTVELYHHESATRGHPMRNKKTWHQHQHDLAIFTAKWNDYMEQDPYYNRNLKLKFRF